MEEPEEPADPTPLGATTPKRYGGITLDGRWISDAMLGRPPGWSPINPDGTWNED